MIYLDNSATTKPNEKILSNFVKIEGEVYGNASSKYYKESIDAKNMIKNSTMTILDYFNLEEKDEVLFTSGATEANNIYIQGILKKVDSGHIISTATEHSSVYEILKYYEKLGFEVTYLKPTKEGVFDYEIFKNSFKKNTVLCSMVAVNGETGHINNIEIFSNIAKELNIPFHSDVTQAVGKIDLTNYFNSGVTAVSFSGHKISGIKGIGALVLSTDKFGSPQKLQQLYFGGEQQRGLRPGTLPNGLINSLADTILLLKNNNNDVESTISSISNFLCTKYPDIVKINFVGHKRIANILSIQFKGIINQTLLLSMANEGILAASTGSACSITKPSHILASYGLNKEEISYTIRISVSQKIEDLSILEKL